MPERFSLSQLKRAAALFMLIDHAAVVLLERNQYLNLPSVQILDIAMRLVGRMAFPLYCFFLAEGFLHTKSRRKYARRLFFLAILSELPFDLAVSGKIWYPGAQNTVFTLLLGLGALVCLECFEAQKNRLPALAGVCCFMAAAEVLKTDYGAGGILLILSLYLFRHRPPERMFFGCLILFADYKNFMGIAAWIAFFFINHYNGEKGKDDGRMFYVFYPAHLMILYMLGEILYVLHF